ncbi:hypothetical protein [Roseateles sp.]|uniref:hypothetical protein n=1 Tax=Roseateles sp. TaxID=1971397 RepID=UPI003BAC58BD
MAGSSTPSAPAEGAKHSPETPKTWQRKFCAMPDGQNGIRADFDEDEPPAVIFNDQALPSALVSWAWSELMALNSLLDAITERAHHSLGDPDIAGAVQATLVPVINALRFSEERVCELRIETAERRARHEKKTRLARGR